MTLADIKFKYLDKIDSVNNRIDRYQSIINGYAGKIEKAEKEEEQNIDSVLKAKSDYEKKIENMSIVKTHYQEFVDTSDYLMQYLNENTNSLLIRKNEELSNENQSLLEKINLSEKKIVDKKIEIDRLNNKKNSCNSRIKKRDDDILKYKIEIRELKDRMKAKDEAYSSLRDISQEKIKKKVTEVRTAKVKIRKLSAENKTLQDTNEHLEKKCETLQKKYERIQNYCNDLLNRKSEVEL